MLFATVGTYRGDRLVRAVDEISRTLEEQVVIQIGRSRFIPQNCTFFRFKPSLEGYFRGARLVIGHGGVGTTFEAISLGVRYVAVSSIEIPDAHQEELLERLEREKLLIWCRDLTDLPRIIQEISGAPLKRYQKPECRIVERLADLLR